MAAVPTGSITGQMLRVRVFGLHVSLALYPEADLSVSDKLPVPQEEHAVFHDEAPNPDTEGDR